MKTLFIIQGGNVAYRKSLMEGQKAIMTKEMSGLINPITGVRASEKA